MVIAEELTSLTRALSGKVKNQLDNGRFPKNGAKKIAPLTLMGSCNYVAGHVKFKGVITY